LKKVEGVRVLAAEANQDHEAGTVQDPNPDHGQNRHVVHDPQLLEDPVPGPGRLTAEEQDLGLVSVVQDQWKGKMEVQTKDPLPEAEVELQKEAGPDPDLRREKTGMEINRITKI
jgi:hypothetical protein